MKRQLSLELLRIFAMFLIVCHHFAVHGAIHAGKISELLQNSFLKIIWVQFLASGGKLGVNLFVLITGFFLIKRPPKPSSLVKLYVTTATFSLSIYFIFFLWGKIDFSFSDGIDNLFPISTGRYWFITCYAVLFLLAPFLGLSLRKIYSIQDPVFQNTPPHPIIPYSFDNIRIKLKECLKNIFLFQWFFKYEPSLIEKRGFIIGLSLNIILTILFSLLPFFVLKGRWPSFYVNDLVWFVVLFCWASFFSYFSISIYKKSFYVLIFCILFLFTRITYLDILLLKGKVSGIDWLFSSSQISTLILFISLWIFLYFKDLSLGDHLVVKKMITFFASATLGVYLIHDNNYVRGIIWSSIFDTKKHFYSDSFLLWSIYVILIVYFSCTILDRFVAFFERPLFEVISQKMSKVDQTFKEIFK